MKQFDKDKLAELDIYLGEPNEQVREGMRAILRAEDLCLSLAENVAMMEINYENLEAGEIDLIEKLAQAFRMAIDSAAKRKKDEEDQLAAKYEGRIAGNAVDI
jgi:hypothetical protein